MATSVRKQSATPARKLPVTGTAELRWEGRVIPMIRERNGVWRIRSRSKSFPVDAMLGTSDLAAARQKARELLARSAVQEPARGTLEEAVTIYRGIPKKCADDTAEGNISRLRSVVTVAFGSGLESVKVSRLPDLWHTYVAKRQGREAADYSRRARENISINSAMRQAASIFRKKLHPHYRRAGIILPADCATVEYLPGVTLRPAEADDAAMVKAWEALMESGDATEKTSETISNYAENYSERRDLWLAIGLARFAGLRQAEILACRGKWIVQRGAGAVVELQDREEDGHRTKTGRRYSALILHPGLAAWLLALPAEAAVITRTDAARWLSRAPQEWLRPFTGAATKPLHRLRGLYADHIRRETEDAILARQAGIRAAQQALGHTTPETTERHYLTPD